MKSIAVGFFDGVHLGHQAILKGAESALTFRNHPLSVLAPANAPVLIMTPDERLDAIRACGVKEPRMLDFTRETAECPPEEFAARHFAGKRVVCGENWRFGRGGRGDANLLRAMGIAVEVVPYAEHKGERVSSSRIRESLARGEIGEANAMLGRRFSVCGTRQAGKGMGAKIGFPTVNLAIGRRLGIPFGAYEVASGDRRGVANYGLAPTMGAEAWREPVLEVHWLCDVESSRKFSPACCSVEFVRFIRPERKFASVEELRQQIVSDCGGVS